MRKCKECREVKNIKEFYPTNKSYCKECQKERAIIWMKNNPQRTKEIQAKLIAKRKADPDYKEKQAKFYREWYAKHGRKRARNYREIIKLWDKLNPEKCKTRKLVSIALKLGKLKKPKYCSECKIEQKLVAHHDDYEFPLKVRWLCYSCHKKLKH